MRLDKYVAGALGVSRTQAVSLIRAGRIKNGSVPAKSGSDAAVPPIYLDGALLEYAAHLHIMMDKQAGLLTAARDRSLPTVMDALPDHLKKRGIQPVGRLDRDVTGILIFTTDGELNHRLASPNRGVDKEYIATVDGALAPSDVDAFASGLDLGDFTARPALLRIIRPDTASVVIHEGKFHQVKRMFDAVGKPVLTLRRVAFGGLSVDPSLGPGGWRPLSAAEAALLYSAVALTPPQ